MSVRFNGVDFGGGVVDELKGIVGAMHHLLIGFTNKMNKFRSAGKRTQKSQQNDVVGCHWLRAVTIP